VVHINKQIEVAKCLLHRFPRQMKKLEMFQRRNTGNEVIISRNIVTVNFFERFRFTKEFVLAILEQIEDSIAPPTNRQVLSTFDLPN